MFNTPYNVWTPITPSDTVNFDGSTYSATATNKPKPCQAIYVGTSSTTKVLVAIQQDGTARTFTGVLAGTILPIAAIRVNNTTTDVTNLLALYVK
jgi:hypothetical protein